MGGPKEDTKHGKIAGHLKILISIHAEGSLYKKRVLLNIRTCPYFRIQGHVLLSEQAFQFEPFQNLKFSVIRACPLMRGNTLNNV